MPTNLAIDDRLIAEAQDLAIPVPRKKRGTQPLTNTCNGESSVRSSSSSEPSNTTPPMITSGSVENGHERSGRHLRVVAGVAPEIPASDHRRPGHRRRTV